MRGVPVHPDSAVLFILLANIQLPVDMRSVVDESCCTSTVRPQNTLVPLNSPVAMPVCLGWVDYHPFAWKARRRGVGAGDESAERDSAECGVSSEDSLSADMPRRFVKEKKKLERDEKESDEDEEEEEEEEEEDEMNSFEKFNHGDNNGDNSQELDYPKKRKKKLTIHQKRVKRGLEESSTDSDDLNEGYHPFAVDSKGRPLGKNAQITNPALLQQQSSSSSSSSSSRSSSSPSLRNTSQNKPSSTSRKQSERENVNPAEPVVAHRMVSFTKRRWMKRLMLRCKDLSVPSLLAKKAGLSLPRDTKQRRLWLRREPISSLFFSEVSTFWVFDPTRSFLDPNPTLPRQQFNQRVLSSISTPPHILSGIGSSSVSGATLFLTHPDSAVSRLQQHDMLFSDTGRTLALSRYSGASGASGTHTDTQADTILSPSCPFPESVFPFTVLHPYELHCWQFPFASSAPTGLQPAAPPPCLSFRLELGNLPDYAALPPYLSVPFGRGSFTARHAIRMNKLEELRNNKQKMKQKEMQKPTQDKPQQRPQQNAAPSVIKTEFVPRSRSVSLPKKDTDSILSPVESYFPSEIQPSAQEKRDRQTLLITELPCNNTRVKRIPERADGKSSKITIVFDSFTQKGLTSEDCFVAILPTHPFFAFHFYTLPQCWTNIGICKPDSSRMSSIITMCNMFDSFSHTLCFLFHACF